MLYYPLIVVIIPEIIFEFNNDFSAHQRLEEREEQHLDRVKDVKVDKI